MIMEGPWWMKPQLRYLSSLILILGIIIVLKFNLLNVDATPDCTLGNGHAYEVIPTTSDYVTVKALAEAQTFNSCPGYLVTITNSTEGNYVLNLASPNSTIFYIGARGIGITGTFDWDCTSCPEMGLIISTGFNYPSPNRVCQQPSGYCPWEPTEPSDNSCSDCPVIWVVSDGWDDTPVLLADHYVIEYGSPTCDPCITPSVSASVSTSVSASWSLSVSPSQSAPPTQSLTTSQSVSPSPSFSASPSTSTTQSMSVTISQSNTPTPSISAAQSQSYTPSQSTTLSISTTSSPNGSVSLTLSKSPSSSLSINISQTITPSLSSTASSSQSSSQTQSTTPNPSMSASPSTTLVESFFLVPSTTAFSTESVTPTSLLSESSASQRSPLTSEPTPTFTSTPAPSTPTSTPTPSQTPIQVGGGNQCSGDKILACPDDTCVSSLTDCDSGVDIDGKSGDVKPIDYEISDPDKPVTAIISTGDKPVATVEVPSGTFKKGWTISITSTPIEKQQKLTSDPCGSKTETPPVQTVSFQIIVHDAQGKQVDIQNLPQGIRLSTLAEIPNVSPSKLNKLCFAYSSKSDEGWSCLEDTTFQKTKKKDVYVVTATTDHLTSFAVFFDIGENNDCHKTYWIVSMAIIGASALFSILVILAERYIPGFRRFVAGYVADAKSMDQISKKLQYRSQLSFDPRQSSIQEPGGF